MTRLFLFLLPIFLLPTPLLAQAGSVLLRLRIIDSFTRETVESAAVTVCEADSSTVLLEGLRRERRFSNGVAMVDGYCGDVPRRTAYVVKVSREGYEAQCVRILVPERGHGRRVKEWQAKDIVMRRASSSFDRTLGEATVTASRVAMVVKGDTVEYDARAFRLAEGSMLDNLMAMLPGVTLTEDGRIYVNGEFVKKLMVNGRDFFNGNPKVALDNLPAYTVDKVRAYHEGPAWSHLIDEKNADHSRKPLVMDVRLKREYAQGWLANIEAGGGSKTRGGWDGVYLARLFAMRYTDHSGLALYGSMNNLGDNQSPGRKGEWKKMDVTQGEREVKVGGVNLDIDGKRTGTKFSSTLEVRREDIVSLTGTTSVSGEGAVRQSLQGSSAGDAGQTDLKWTGRIFARSKRTFFQIDPSVQYLHNRESGQTLTQARTSASQEEDDWEDFYTRTLSNLRRSDNWETGLTAFGFVKSPISGKNYNLNAEVKYKHAARADEQADALRYADVLPGGFDWNERRRDDLPEMSYNYQVGVGRNVLDFKHKGISYQLDVNYTYRQVYEQGARTRELQTLPESDAVAGGSAWEGLPSVENEAQWAIDGANTYHTRQMSRRHNPGLYAAVGNKKFTFNGNLYANFDQRSIRDVRNFAPQSLRRHDFSFSFFGNVNISPLGMSIMYHYMPELPSMLHLLDVRDAADPLQIHLGNADLKRTTRHYFTISHNSTRKKRQRTLYAALTGEVIADAGGDARSYDAQTGITTYRPRNISGNWWGRLDLNYGQALDKAGCLMLSSNGWFKLAHSVDFATDETTGGSLRSVVDNYQLSEELTLNYRTLKGIHVGAKAKVLYTNQRARPLTYRSNTSTDYAYGLTCTLPVTQHLAFETDLMTYARRGYAEQSMNTTDWVWNAALSYTLGKQKQWLIRAVGFDLLHQLASVRREVNAQGYVETWYNTVPSYATLHVTFRFDAKPRRKKQP